MSKGWDSVMLKKLKSLIGKGLSTSEMGKKLGMSKNAVVGKLNRLGWNAKATESNAKKDIKKAISKKVDDGKKSINKSTNKQSKTQVKKNDIVDTKKVASNVKLRTNTKETKKTTQQVDKNVESKTSEKHLKEKTQKTVQNMLVHQRMIQHALQMANLKPNQCRWPIGDPDSDSFHFCGETVFAGKPYCYEHCRQAYQFAPPKKTK